MTAVGDGDSRAAGLQVSHSQRTYGAASGAMFLATLYPHLVRDLLLCSVAVCQCNSTSPFLISNAKLSCKLRSDGLLSFLIHLASTNLSHSPRFNLCSHFASYLQGSSTQIHHISRAKRSYPVLHPDPPIVYSGMRNKRMKFHQTMVCWFSFSVTLLHITLISNANWRCSPRFTLGSRFASYLQRSSTQIHCISRAKLSYKSLPVPLFTLGRATNG